MSTYIGIVAGVVVTAILGLVIAGVLFYRGIQGGYFTIITLALAIIAEQTATSWSSVTGGFNGLTGIPPIELGVPGFLSVELLGLPLYYMALVVSALVFLASRRVAASPFGSVLVAINENETKARALGYEIERYKTLVFALGSAMAGLSGALYAGYQGFVSPNLLGFLLSTEVLLWILIGGRGTLIGAVVGTVFLLVFESLISGVFQFTWTLLLGIVLLIIVLRYPDGIVGVASQASLPWQGDAPEVELE
jgi:ABC-type branched-subunit amino acid transport system permease subunit